MYYFSTKTEKPDFLDRMNSDPEDWAIFELVLT